MASIKTVLYLQKTLKDKTHPIMLQIIHDRKVRKIALGYSVEPEFWDDVKGRVNNKHQNSKSLNSLISQKIGDAEKEKIRLEAEQSTFSIDELLNRIKKTKPKTSFIEYTENLVAEMMKARKIGNANIYQYALNFVKSSSNKPDILFTEIDFHFLKSLETLHFSRKGNTVNGLSVYMRTIRAIFNRAIHDGIIDQKYYPFSEYKIKSNKTMKRAISKDDLSKIKDIELIEGTEIWHARSYFLFSFYMIGMSWVDLANLKVSNINGDRIYYKRAKTGKEYSIKINENISDILSYYCERKKPDDFIFPIIKRQGVLIERYKDIKNALKTYNKYLKEIALKTGITSNMTSYVSRHSWASIANFSGVPIGIIKEGMGHDDIKTTQTYLADFNYSDIDKANELISNL